MLCVKVNYDFTDYSTGSLFEASEPKQLYDFFRFLNEKCTQGLQPFYDSKGHVKKQLTGDDSFHSDLSACVHQSVKGRRGCRCIVSQTRIMSIGRPGGVQ